MSAPAGSIDATSTMKFEPLAGMLVSANALTASEDTASAAAATLAKVFVNFIVFVLHKNFYSLLAKINHTIFICNFQLGFCTKNLFLFGETI